MNSVFTVGIDIGGTKCALSLMRHSAVPQLLYRVAMPTLCSEPDVQIQQFIRQIIEWNSEHPISAVGISCGSPLDEVRGIIQSPPNIPEWQEVHICERIESAVGIPCFIMNDANACALAELRYGAGRGLSDMVFLTFGTGLGAGIVVGGKVVRGASSGAGEIGHVRIAKGGAYGYGKYGSVEGFCSGGGIARQAIEIARSGQANAKALIDEAGSVDGITTQHIARLARRGDELSAKLFGDCAERFGGILAAIIDFLNPQAIVIGGVYMRCRDLLEPTVLDVIQRECLPVNAAACKIVGAELDENIGDYAANVVAMEGLNER